MRASICRDCYMVREIEEPRGRLTDRHLDNSPHRWVPAKVEECPYLERTPTGRVSPKRIRAADQACLEAGSEIHDHHHYGDAERRHYTVAQ